jgi:hypothetical protein
MKKLTDEKIKAYLPEFLDLYAQQEYESNDGGMKFPQLFGMYCFLKEVNPSLVIESGVWRGLGTWMIEKTLPDADIISFDINLALRNYISEDVTYIENDVSNMDWNSFFSEYPEKNLENTLIFFDDHIDFSSRLELLENVNIKYVIYEDNYPPQQGDCISPKQILESPLIEDEIKQKFSSLVKDYFEFPPMYLPEKTRWGDDFNNYNVKKPIFSEKNELLKGINSFVNYTYICCIEMDYDRG